MDFATELHHAMDQKMKEQMELGSMSWIEVQFLKKAVDILIDSRRALMYTYVFAFYQNKSNQKDIFEDNQKDLEIATEALSEYLEQFFNPDIEDKDGPSEVKQKVLDKYQYCESRSKVMLEHVHGGKNDKIWQEL